MYISNTMAVFSQTRSFLNGLVPISIFVSVLVTLLSYFTVDRIVRGYESKIETQNVLIARKNKDLTDSIKYAGYLQNSYLPSRNTMEKLFSESFILLKPREMVSGDFFYVDQFGGPNDKKFMMSRLKKKLLEIYLMPVDRQLELLEETLAQWQGDTFQVDDITVMGVKITPELL